MINVCVFLIVVAVVIVIGSLTILAWMIADEILNIIVGQTMTEMLIDSYIDLIGLIKGERYGKKQNN